MEVITITILILIVIFIGIKIVIVIIITIGITIVIEIEIKKAIKIVISFKVRSPKMIMKNIKVDKISVTNGLTRHNSDVTQLQKSIETVGLLQPIVINRQFQVIAGRRRFKVVRELGWNEIGCIILETSSIKQELSTLEENIIRKNYKGLELDNALLKRKKLYEIINPDTRQHVAAGVATAGDKKAESFVNEFSKKIGMSASSVNKSIARAEKAVDWVNRARENGTLKRAEVDKLVSLSPKKQEALEACVTNAKNLGMSEAVKIFKRAEDTDTAIEKIMNSVKNKPSFDVMVASKAFSKKIRNFMESNQKFNISKQDKKDLSNLIKDLSELRRASKPTYVIRNGNDKAVEQTVIAH